MSTEMYQIPKKLSNYDISCNAVGIDFGTTECCAAVIRKNGPELVVLDPTTRTRTMPSFIAYDETNPKCGQIVINRMWYKAEHTVYDIKRILGRNLDDIIVDPIWPFRVIQRKGKGTFIQVETYNKGKLKIESEKIAGTLLGYIKNMIEEFENRTLTDVVISVPSEISESQKAATKMAAEYSGWKNIHFIPEPVAAAFAYFNEMEIPNNSNILICDFGGGTVDICIAKVVGDNLKVLTFCGDSYLGGRDFDRLLFDHFASILTNKHGINLAKKNYILKPKCQVIKHDLSVATEIALNVGDFHPERDEIITITRDEFETMSMNLIIRTKNVILQAILKANLLKQDIDFVFQVGGGCRMPMIKKLLADIFPKANHQCSIHPDEIVAHGAALYAYYIKTCMLEQNDKLMQNLGDLMQQFTQSRNDFLSYVKEKPENDIIVPEDMQETMRKAKEDLNLDTANCYNFAFVGHTKTGKSSLINAIRGIEDTHPDAAGVNITECTMETKPYTFPDPQFKHVKIYDIPGSGTLTHNSERYYEDKCLCAFDCLIIVTPDTLGKDEIDLAIKSLKYNQPIAFVRSRCDIVLDNAKKRKEIKKIDQNAIHSYISQMTNFYIEEIQRTKKPELTRIPCFFVSAYTLRDLMNGEEVEAVYHEKALLDYIKAKSQFSRNNVSSSSLTM